MTINELQKITRYIAEQRGNCGEAKTFWQGLFDLMESMLDERIKDQGKIGFIKDNN